MQKGFVYATSYCVEYNFLIPCEKKWIPPHENICEARDIFENITLNSSKIHAPYYRDISETLKKAINKNATLKQKITCDEGFAKIVLEFKNRKDLDDFEKMCMHLLIH